MGRVLHGRFHRKSVPSCSTFLLFLARCPAMRNCARDSPLNRLSSGVCGNQWSSFSRSDPTCWIHFFCRKIPTAHNNLRVFPHRLHTRCFQVCLLQTEGSSLDLGRLPKIAPTWALKLRRFSASRFHDQRLQLADDRFRQWTCATAASIPDSLYSSNR